MSLPKTEHEARRWLAKELGEKGVHENLWAELSDRSYVRSAVEEQTLEAFEELADVARSYRRAVPGSVRLKPRVRRGKGMDPSSLLTAAESQRADVFSLFLGRLAARDGAVMRFRRTALGGEVLTESEARTLLCSPAPYLLTSAEFTQSSIPLRDHQAEASHKREETGPATWRDHVALEITGAGRKHAFVFELPRSFGDGMWLQMPPGMFGTATPFGKSEPIVRESSVFDHLRRAGDSLSSRFPWEAWDAVWFTLTNRCPFVPPVRAGGKSWASQTNSRESYRRSVITLDVDPWVSSRSLERVFRAHQKQFQGARNREAPAKSLEVFDFVTARREEQGTRRTWESLMKEWNRGHPARRYAEYRNFRRDYERAQQRLLFPKPPALDLVPLR